MTFFDLKSILFFYKHMCYNSTRGDNMEILETIMSMLYELNNEEIEGVNSEKLSDYFLNENSHYMILQNKLFTNNHAIHLRKHTRLVSVPLHKHDYVECSYIIQGSITHIIDKKEIILNTGDLIIINQGCAHEITKCTKEDIAINFIIKPNFLKQMLTHCSDNQEFSDFIIRNYINQNATHNHYVFNNVNVDLRSIINRIINHYFSNDSPEKVNLLFTYLLTELLTNHLQCEKESSVNGMDYIFMFTKRYINKEYASASLEELSTLLNISYSHLSTSIKRESGLSFKQLLLKKRLEVAMDLVVGSSVPIKEIAHLIGYENMTFFYRIFKEQYGANPYEFRKTKI